jgi:hypothetical protein
MPRECPPAFRSARAVAGTGSTKQRSVRPPSAISPKRPAEEVGLRLLFQRRFFRWRFRVLKLKPRLWQNSLRRIPLLTNSATNC